MRIALNQASRRCRKPSLKETSPQENEGTTFKIRNILPESNGHPEARIFPNPRRVLVTTRGESAERSEVDLSGQGLDSGQRVPRKVSVIGVPERNLFQEPKI